ncbi:MAG TPA: RDD family protein [Candidatus Binatia bacterium]|nr:RDD family protein [Candidatus Binatia bacterium]
MAARWDMGGSGTDLRTRQPDALSRGCALLVDLVLLSVLDLLLGQVYGVATPAWSPFPLGAPFFTWVSSGPALDWGWQVLVMVAYFGVFEMLLTATPGKLLCRIRVSRPDGSRPGWAALLVRNLLRPVDALPFAFLIGGLLVLLTGSGQRLGDLAAGTVVIGAQDTASARLPRLRLRVAVLAGLAALLVAGSAGFDYFGRPPLVIQGWAHGQTMLGTSLAAYRLGAPAWGEGSVTYPVTYSLTSGDTCQGHVDLDWAGPLSGWEVQGGDATC